MKFTSVFLSLTILAIAVNGQVHLYGTALNTKGVSNGSGVNASETTAHSLGDVSQSKAYAAGDDESNARTDAQAVWVSELQGANSDANAVQTGNGNTLADSWSKSFTPTNEYYLNNTYSYVQFLNSLTGGQVDDETRAALADRVNQSIANFENPDYEYNGARSFNLEQARSSGNDTWASTNSQAFDFNDNTLQRGDAAASAADGWATTNSSDWALNRANYNTVNKNSAAFGNNAYSAQESNLYHAGNGPHQSGNAWGEADGEDAVAYSTVNANNFGYGAVSGSTNTYSNGDGAQSVSEYRGNPYN